MKIFRLLNARVIADDQRRTAAGGSRDNAQCLAVRPYVPSDRRIRPDISDIQRSRKQRLNGRWTRVKALPLNLDVVAQSLLEPAFVLAHHCLRMGNVRKGSDAHNGLSKAR